MMKNLLPFFCLLIKMVPIAAQTTAITQPTIQIPYKGAINPFARTEAKGRLLWYKGKKINDSILITPEAKLVLYSKQRDMVALQPPAKTDPSLKINDELTKTEERKAQVFEKVMQHKTGVMLYPSVIATFNEFDRINDQYSELLKNTIELPPSIPATAFNNSRGQKGGVSAIADQFIFSIVPAYIKKAFEEVLTSMKNHPPIDFPAPPAREFGSCFYQCDSAALKEMSRKEEEWLKTFIEYEAGIVQQSLSIFKKMSELGLEADAEAAPINDGLDKAIDFAFARATNKVDLLIRKYGNDFSRLSSVIKTALSVEKQKQLIGGGNEKSYASLITRLLPLFDGFDKYLEQQMDERNYDAVFNMAFILGIERQKQLLGGEESGTGEYTEKYMQKLEAFNRFKIDLQIDYYGTAEECRAPRKEHFTATNLSDQYGSVLPMNCKLMLFPAPQHLPDKPFHFGDDANFLLEISNGEAYEEEWSEDGERCQLVTHDLKGMAVRPRMLISSISFCGEDMNDSLQFYDLHLPLSREGTTVDKRYRYWEFDEFNTLLKNDGFQDNYPKELEALSMEIEALEAEQGMYEMNPPHTLSLPEVERHYINASRSHFIRRRSNELEERNNPSVVVFDAKNRSETIIDVIAHKNYRAQYSEDRLKEANIAIKVKVVHAPLPYKKQVAVKK